MCVRGCAGGGVYSPTFGPSTQKMQTQLWAGLGLGTPAGQSAGMIGVWRVDSSHDKLTADCLCNSLNDCNLYGQVEASDYNFYLGRGYSLQTKIPALKCQFTNLT